MTATGSDKKDAKVRVAILLHCAGPNILDIYDQATWEDPDHKNDPVKVLQMIEIYCNPRKNEVLESHRFWSTPVQEPFDNFLTELRKRASTCNFKGTDRMNRDKIVFTTSGKLQELLLRKDELDLNKAVQLCRAYEQSLKHVQEIRDKDVNKVQQSTARPKKNTV